MSAAASAAATFGAGVELPRAHARLGTVPERELEPSEAVYAEVPDLHGLQAGAAPYGLGEVGYRRRAVEPGVLLGELACVREPVEVAADEPFVAGSLTGMEGVRVEGVPGTPPAAVPQGLDESREPVVQALGPAGPVDAVLVRRAPGRCELHHDVRDESVAEGMEPVRQDGEVPGVDGVLAADHVAQVARVDEDGAGYLVREIHRFRLRRRVGRVSA